MISLAQEEINADNIIDQIEPLRLEAENRDNVNKSLASDYTSLINNYQLELSSYDGNTRVELTEDHFTDSVNKKFQNNFFPNDSNTSLPSVSDGIWKNFVPFFGNIAIGKKYDETYDLNTNEVDLITDVQNAITAIEAFTDIQRSTGQYCVPVDSIITYPAMVAAGDLLKTSIQVWEDFINAIPVVSGDSDGTREAQNILSSDDIANTVSIIDTWQALDDYDTSHGQSTCAGFNSYDHTLLGPTKFRDTELAAIKDEITARLAFISIRITQIETNLGSISVNADTGRITSATGLYGFRARLIDMRLNLMSGTLSKLSDLEKAQQSQTELKASNDSASSIYDSIMVATKFRSPGNNTNIIQVLDASSFSVSNAVYVVSDEFDEISANITGISSNTITLDTVISRNYLESDNARLYKLI
jgi:hypothetical protein